jgi:hypothetical protein
MAATVQTMCDPAWTMSDGHRKVCAQVSTKNKAQRKVNDTQIFVDEVETLLREKPLRGNQTQEFHYLEDKARYKTVTLTCTDAVVVL